VYVTAGVDRRSTGTHYTPRSHTEPIVQHTLEPLVYIGPAEGQPREQWQLRSAAELLDLKICDMAMGSGAFLVQADRYMAERLVEAWENAEQALIPGHLPPSGGSPREGEGRTPRPRITPEGKLSTGAPGETLIPDDADERLSLARRIVADRCLYGVDKNPLAVEMAKLSLWLVTLAKDRPFTFLDHALKCGDSLVGADEDMFQRWAHGIRGSEMTLFDEQLRGQLTEARQKRRELESFEVKDVRDAERKAALLAEADRTLECVKLGCDLIIGVRLLDLKPKEKEARLNTLLLDYMAGKPLNMPEAQEALDAARKARAFHWPFEFPEIFERGGFSAFVGNPPFIGGQHISGNLGKDYLNYLKTKWSHARGSADLCAYFFLRSFENLQVGGTLGLLATNTIAQGDTRALGLEYIVQKGGVIYHANASMNWPGTAAVVVSVIHVISNGYMGEKTLDGRIVPVISSLLDSTTDIGDPYRLAQNAEKCFQGSIVLGMGFVLDIEQADALIEHDSKNAEVIFPYLSGEDLNSRPDQKPSRAVINFLDWPLEKAERYPDCLSIVRDKVYCPRPVYLTVIQPVSAE
jgi:hypothetical protein